MSFDAIDIAILDALQVDGRLSWRDLGEQVGLSAPAARERVRSLEAAGVIEGYRAVVSPDLVGLPIRAIIRVSNQVRGAGTDSTIIDDIAQRRPEIIECHRVTGSEGYVIRAMVRSTAHLEELLEEFWVHAETVTNIVTSTPVQRRGLRLAELLEPGQRKRH